MEKRPGSPEIEKVERLLAYLRACDAEYGACGLDVAQFIEKQELRLQRLKNEDKAIIRSH